MSAEHGVPSSRTVKVVEEPTPAHDTTSSESTSPTGERLTEGAHSATPRDHDVSPETPSSSSAPKHKHPNEFWLALASSVVALVVGAIGAGGGWYTAAQHDKQETVRQEVSSTRSQEKDAYVGFINSASDVAIAVQLQVKAIENRYPYFLYSPIPEGKSDLETKFTDLGHALGLAQLYGGVRVRDESNKVFDAAEQGRFVVIGWNLAHPASDPNSAPCPEVLAFENKTESNRQQLGNAIDRFNDAARDDLGISPIPSSPVTPEPLLPKDACANYPH